MKDQDQKLLWEAYVTEKDESVAARTKPKDKLNKSDFLPKKVRDEINKEEDKSTVPENHENQETKCEPGYYYCAKDKVCKKEATKGEKEQNEIMLQDLKEEGFDNIQFTAEGRYDQRMVYDVVYSWISEQTSGLESPHDWEQYGDPEELFKNAKQAVRDAMEDMKFSDVKEFVERQKRILPRSTQGDEDDQQGQSLSGLGL